MTPAEGARALARCDEEIARINQEGETGEHPAWLIALGTNDWQMEKRAIEREDAK